MIVDLPLRNVLEITLFVGILISDRPRAKVNGHELDIDGDKALHVLCFLLWLWCALSRLLFYISVQHIERHIQRVYATKRVLGIAGARSDMSGRKVIAWDCHARPARFGISGDV